MQLKIHTTEQPESDITTFILSCNRLQLLDKTINSYMQTKDLPTRIVILDDSAVDGVFEQLVTKYGSFTDIVCFPENRGLFWAKDFMTSFCFTEYIFYVEDDWMFLKSGYLSKSKEILQKYRDIGSIDISWRTFEEEGLDTHEQQLIDNCFYYKKPWRISKNHLHWFIWQGSPNLKRREDLLLLGRVEKYYTEWNVDRKFYSLGFKGVYLNDRYVVHTGDKYSVMVNKRPNEHATPETLFPEELKKDRIFPTFDYYSLDHHILKDKTHDFVSKIKKDRVLITSLIDINRESVDGRNFVNHYINGLNKILTTDEALVVFCDESLFDHIYRVRGSKPTLLLERNKTHLDEYRYINVIKNICNSESWVNQAEWMKTSIIRNPYYIALTLYKMEMLMLCSSSNVFNADNFYWIDCGICNSYGISQDICQFDFSRIPKDKFFITSYPYWINKEIHGYSIDAYKKLCNKIPDRVLRASLFGGNKESIQNMYNHFDYYIRYSSQFNYIGTEEAIFTAINLNHPDFFNEFRMVNGDMKNYFNTMLD